MTKETAMNDKRERDIYVENETYTHEKRVVIKRQKRPMHMTKESEMHDDRGIIHM